MATDALQVVTLEEAKRNLSELTDRKDKLIEECIRRAVSHVSAAGVPLVEELRTYELYRFNGSTAAVLQPWGWPKPLRATELRYRNYNENLPEMVAVQSDKDTDFTKDVSNRWLVQPSMFGLDEFPSWGWAAIDVMVGLDPIPDRHKDAVLVAVTAIYNGNQEGMVEIIESLID